MRALRSRTLPCAVNPREQSTVEAVTPPAASATPPVFSNRAPCTHGPLSSRAPGSRNLPRMVSHRAKAPPSRTRPPASTAHSSALEILASASRRFPVIRALSTMREPPSTVDRLRSRSPSTGASSASIPGTQLSPTSICPDETQGGYAPRPLHSLCHGLRRFWELPAQSELAYMPIDNARNTCVANHQRRRPCQFPSSARRPVRPARVHVETPPALTRSWSTARA